MYIDMDCSCMGKNLDRFLQPHILMMLYRKPMYGLEIINELEKQTMFLDKRPDPTGVYRYLKKMEEAGVLTSEMVSDIENEKPKRFYNITEEGRHCLANWTVALGQYGVDIIELVGKLEETIDK